MLFIVYSTLFSPLQLPVVRDITLTTSAAFPITAQIALFSLYLTIKTGGGGGMAVWEAVRERKGWWGAGQLQRGLCGRER